MSQAEETFVPDVDALKALMREFYAWERNRGKLLATQGAVRDVRAGEGEETFVAEVEDKETFRVALYYDGQGWEGDCTCPKEFNCQHIYGVLTALLARHASTPQDDPIPPSELAKRLAGATQRKLSGGESAWLKTFRQLYLRCRSKRRIDSWDLGSLGFYSYGNEWGRLDLWPHFPKDDYEFWLYVAHALSSREIPIPPFLVPITQYDLIEHGLEEMKRRKQITYWEQQLQLASGWQAHAQRTGLLDFRLVLAPREMFLEWKSERETAFKRLKASVAKRFHIEYSHGKLEIVPEASALWHLFIQTYLDRYGYYRDMTYAEPQTKQFLNPLLRLPVLQGRILTAAGVPFPRATEPLKWHLSPAKTEQDDYRLHLARADGSIPPPAWVILPGNPTLYVAPDGIYPAPALQEGALDVGKVHAIPAPALETAHGLDFILKLGLSLPSRIQERVERVGLRVKLSCELKPSYAGSQDESIFVQVVAQTDDGQPHEILTRAGWQADWEARKSKRNSDKIYLYDRAELDGCLGLIEALGLKWEEYRKRWQVRLSRNLPQRFAEWLESLPKSMEVNLDENLATLTKPPSEATVKLDCTEAGVDWFDLKVVLNVADTELTPEELQALLNAKGKFVRLGKKGWRRLRFNLTAEEDERLARLGLNSKDFSAEPQRLHALQLADRVAAPLLPEAQAEHIQRRVTELKTRVTPPVPDVVHAQLRPYQVEGFHFLAYLTTNNFGGILADDMGLGKTVQALTWLAWLRTQPERRIKPTLVVCPKSVMDTWSSEAKRFTPDLNIKAWQGGDGKALTAALKGTDLLVMNYAQLRSLEEVIVNITWLAVILDEGQYIKNPESQTARVARSLEAEYRLVLSGTPIENRLLDLWSLMAFAMPGVLGNRAQFRKRFDVTDDPLARRRLAARVRPFLLRRTKGQVARDLPDRTEEDLYCELEGQQKVLYQAEFKRAQQMLLNVHTRQELNEFRFHFLTSLLRLRQICCHPGLYDATAKHAESAKLNAFLELVEPLMDEGHKVLIFSQFVSMLEILRRTVAEKKWQHFYLAGDTENRGPLVEQFQQAPGAALFLISLKAGGFGLNLTAASYVVLFDPWWNPAVESQAIDRTHRIGQTSKVIAYRLLAKGSIEEKIRALQRTKSALVADVLGEDSFAGSLTLEDLQFLFSDDPTQGAAAAP